MKVTTEKDIMISLRGEDAIVQSLKNGKHYRLNSTAFRIWQLIEVYGDTELALEIMLQEYDVDVNILKDDIDELIIGMQEAGLIQKT